jgi:hypothetical protein
MILPVPVVAGPHNALVRRLLILLLTAGCTLPSPAVPGAPAVPHGSAADALSSLVVGGRGSTSDYDRAAFGQAWADVDRNGCDTRNDVLARDLVRVTFKPRTRDCAVLSGHLRDPYSGTEIDFVRGGRSVIEIDHVVALSDAWQTGASTWTDARRLAFANDPTELLAVSRKANRAKSDSDAASWLPPLTGFRCAYVARQIEVKQRYALRVTEAEGQAMARVLTACPGQPMP